jgi:hypothetical protein
VTTLTVENAQQQFEARHGALLGRQNTSVDLADAQQVLAQSRADLVRAKADLQRRHGGAGEAIGIVVEEGDAVRHLRRTGRKRMKFIGWLLAIAVLGGAGWYVFQAVPEAVRPARCITAPASREGESSRASRRAGPSSRRCSSRSARRSPG